MKMLTKDLLQVEKRRPNIRPRYRPVEEYRELAGSVIEAFEPRRTRGEIEAAVEGLETHETFKLVRGLAELLERRGRFERRSPADPIELRSAVYEQGPVTDPAQRRAVLESVADEFGIEAGTLEEALWADREENAVLVERPGIDAGDLLREYNLSLTQTLLFDAVELTFSVSGNYQAIFSRLKYLGLMYDVAEDLSVTVTGPASVLERTRKYGTELAKLVPTVMAAEEWAFTADVETEVGGERRIYEFDLDHSDGHLFPDRTAEEGYDSEVERDFATRIRSVADGWTVRREPTILRADTRVMIPDFSFRRRDHEFYLEVVGFWTPEYLEEKVRKVRTVESRAPLVLAVDASLNCAEEDFDGEAVDQVFFYTDRIPLKPVMDRLNAIEDRIVEADLERLRSAEVDVTVGASTVTPVTDLADDHDVSETAMARHLEEATDGVVSNGLYVPAAVQAELETAIEDLEASSLADVNEVLAEYGVGQDILRTLGYEVEYVSLDQSEARIVRK